MRNEATRAENFFSDDDLDQLVADILGAHLLFAAAERLSQSGQALEAASTREEAQKILAEVRQKIERLGGLSAVNERLARSGQIQIDAEKLNSPE